MARLRETQSISASQQFRAIAYLRWRLFANGFRRKGGKGELAARIFVYPIAAVFALGPTLGAGFAAYGAASSGHLGYLAAVFWAIFALQIVVSINIAAPGLSFDPESLIRFPLNFPRYFTVRLFLGLLSASTIIGTLCLLAAAVGVSVAVPSLTVAAFSTSLALALTNMLLIRMVFAWVDRWLSTRRARELFTGVIIAFSIGIQYLNVTFNGFGKHVSRAEQAARIHAVTHAYQFAAPVLARLPPGLGGETVKLAAQQSISFALLNLFGILLYGVGFLAVFAWRMRKEYRGENLSEANNSPTPPERIARVGGAPRASLAPAARIGLGNPSAGHARASGLTPAVLICLQKEWIYVRRNTAQLYGMIAPLAMVVIFAGKLGSFSRTGYTFPGAAVYALLGVAALSYNCFGMDAAGVQFYFLAPVRFRSVMLAKNLLNFFINFVQIALVFSVITYTSGPPPLLIAVATVLWAIFAALLNMSIGNYRSLSAPKKIDPSKLSRKQASQLSALISFALLIVMAALGFGLIALGRYLSIPWLPIAVLLALALGALLLYLASLASVDGWALKNRESMLEELAKVSL